MKKTKKSFKWSKSTPLSKFLVIILLLLFPFIGVWIGLRYQQILIPSIVETSKVTKPVKNMIASIAFTYGKVFSTYSNGKDYYSVVSLDAPVNPYKPETEEYRTYLDVTECKYRVFKTAAPPSANWDQAEKQLDFTDCVGDPEKLQSVSPDGQIFLFSEGGGGDGYIVLTRGLRGNDGIHKHFDYIITESDTKFVWTDSGVSFQASKASEYYSLENEISLRTISFSELN